MRDGPRGLWNVDWILRAGEQVQGDDERTPDDLFGDRTLEFFSNAEPHVPMLEDLQPRDCGNQSSCSKHREVHVL